MLKKLSKSKYVLGLNCSKVLWLKANKPKLAAETNPGLQHRFDVGHTVGAYAQRLFPGGVLVEEDHTQINEAIKKTRELIDDRVPSVFEAAVEYNNVRCRADILERVEGEDNLWDMYEVKSTTTVKEQHLPDVSVQKYCFSGAGLPIRRVYLTHINNQYVRRGEIEPEKLFIHEELTENIEHASRAVEKNVDRLLEALNSDDCPSIEPGPQCTSPHTCEFYDFCNQPQNPYSIYELSRGKKAANDLAQMGITLLKDIPDNFDLTLRQRKHVESVKTQKPVFDRVALKRHIDQLEYPLHFLDFETVSSAVPLFNKTRPYQNVPFQFSLHVQQEPNSTCYHKWFLFKERRDPREELIQSMLTNIDPNGSIVVYNKGFEKSCIQSLAHDFPKYAERLTALLPRLWDLIVPFKSGDYSHYDFHGSASLKSVLPVLVPSLSYEELEIQNGADVSLLATRWYENDMSEDEWEKTCENLQKYCHLDTLAMVEILKKLRQVIDA
ncbi:MAG: DUF2779 domain-containing protein [Proteobacteria bacterium]|nr:DUF2779 domain-containing protein [Pseudomonadota bacterium]